jgi:hypothetical protein
VFQASVTIWRRSKDERVLRAAPRGSTPWCREVSRQLRLVGYRGRFRSAGGVWFGDFWRGLADRNAALVEARRFERWAKVPTWLGEYGSVKCGP